MPYRKLIYFSKHRLWRKLKRILKIVLIFAIIGLCILFIIASVEEKCNADGCGRTETRNFIQKFSHRDVRPNSEVKRILRWTGFFSDRSWRVADDSVFAPCKVNRCKVTNDKSLLDQSDAVLFHVHDLWNLWLGVSLPTRRHPFQVWILHNLEAPPNILLNYKHFAGIFNWTAWYRRDSDLPFPYGGYTVYPMSKKSQLKMSKKPNWARENTQFAAILSSNCYDHSRKLSLVAELKTLLGGDLDVYGDCGDKICPWSSVCYDILSNYKFYLSFENSKCKEYMTEKFWDALLRRQVPVVYGGRSSADYLKVAPPHSFIYVNDFKDTKSLVDYLYYLAKNETAYNEYLEWTSEMDIYDEISARQKWWCDLCEALHDESRPAQVYTDIKGWVQDDVCPLWSLASQVSRILDGVKIKLGLY